MKKTLGSREWGNIQAPSLSEYVKANRVQLAKQFAGIDFIVQGHALGEPLYFTEADAARIPPLEIVETILKGLKFGSKNEAWIYYQRNLGYFDGENYYLEDSKLLDTKALVAQKTDLAKSVASNGERYEYYRINIDDKDLNHVDWNNPRVNLPLVLMHYESDFLRHTALEQSRKADLQRDLFEY